MSTVITSSKFWLLMTRMLIMILVPAKVWNVLGWTAVAKPPVGDGGRVGVKSTLKVASAETEKVGSSWLVAVTVNS